jgi:hypothetical protein
MGKLSTRQVCSREGASVPAEAILNLVGRRRAGRVILVGCMHIELLIQLAPRLAAVLSRLGRGLRPDGVLFVGITGSLIMTRMRQIQEPLIQQGLASVRTHLEPADIDLLCCRRMPALQALAA